MVDERDQISCMTGSYVYLWDITKTHEQAMVILDIFALIILQ